MTVEDDFAGVARELDALGLSNGTDFRVETIRPDGGMTSSEYIGLFRTKQDQSVFEVFYSDMGRERTLLETPDFAAARERFVDEVIKLGKGHRHGPLADNPSTEKPFMQAFGEATHPAGRELDES